MDFLTSHSLSEIIEQSHKERVVIFKYSANCGTSSRLKAELQKKSGEKNFQKPMYLVVVQDQPTLSKKIEEYFEIRHETPQIISLKKGKIHYMGHHKEIDLNKAFKD